MVSRSGAMAAVFCTTLLSRDTPVSYSVSTGNEAASGVEDYVAWMVDDPSIPVIAMIVEVRQPKRFLAAAKRAREAGKPIVVLNPAILHSQGQGVVATR